MEIIYGIENYTDKRQSAVTVGKFDGLHRGHARLIERLREVRADASMPIVAVTFDISPAASASDGERRLFTLPERAELAKGVGADVLLVLTFDDKLRTMAAETFIRMLCERVSMRLFAAGEDFRFGYKGIGDIRMLGELSERLGFGLVIEKKLQADDEDISSTRIREAITCGQLAKANALLGTPYLIFGEIVHGNHLGTGLGFPTINIVPPADKLLPPYGVYISLVEIDGRRYHGITDIGVKPTVSKPNSDDRVVETHILDFAASIYGKGAGIRLLSFMRPEQKFSTIDDLRRQLVCDKKQAIRFFSGMDNV